MPRLVLKAAGTDCIFDDMVDLSLAGALGLGQMALKSPVRPSHFQVSS